MLWPKFLISSPALSLFLPPFLALNNKKPLFLPRFSDISSHLPGVRWWPNYLPLVMHVTLTLWKPIPYRFILSRTVHTRHTYYRQLRVLYVFALMYVSFALLVMPYFSMRYVFVVLYILWGAFIRGAIVRGKKRSSWAIVLGAIAGYHFLEVIWGVMAKKL